MSIKNPASDELAHLSPDVLIVAAQREESRPTRSRLEPCAQVIFILREKRWSFSAITDWLAQHGVHVAESTVQRFYRTRHRDASKFGPASSPAARQPDSFFDSTHEKPQSRPGRSPAQPASKPKYNTDF